MFYSNSVVKYALSQLTGGNQTGTAALAALAAAAAMLGGGGGTGATAGKSSSMGMILKLFKMCISSSSSQQTAAPSSSDPIQALLAGGDPMGSLHGMLGDLGLQGTEPLPEDIPHYSLPAGSTKDVAILVTGCQAHETSADVRPPGGEPFGALTKTLSDVYFQNQNITNYDLVSQVRKDMSRARFTQNPCLECSEDKANQVFIC